MLAVCDVTQKKPSVNAGGFAGAPPTPPPLRGRDERDYRGGTEVHAHIITTTTCPNVTPR